MKKIITLFFFFLAVFLLGGCGTLHNLGVLDIRPKEYRAEPGLIYEYRMSLEYRGDVLGGVSTVSKILEINYMDNLPSYPWVARAAMAIFFTVDWVPTLAGDIVTAIPVSISLNK